MAHRVTSPVVARKASRVLRSSSATKAEKSAAASALSQAARNDFGKKRK